MFANFYYQRSTKQYGRGPWHEFDGNDEVPVDTGFKYQDFLYIGTVYDQELFKDSELTAHKLTP